LTTEQKGDKTRRSQTSLLGTAITNKDPKQDYVYAQSENKLQAEVGGRKERRKNKGTG
jgi:hypothetical protein